MPHGTLRVYLGAAPGVGKTFAMLDEGWRRRGRGTDVVVGLVETHGRANTAAKVRDLEIVPRRRVAYRDTIIEEMDVDAILQRKPEVVLVDELAHTNAPGSRNEKRWQDVELLLDAGISVISTVNVQHLESLNDVVQNITGIEQRETVPDEVVRRADQIELVDMSPEALRRRMAHGNIYPADRIDAALSNYFRPGNLGALRELALMWVADRVEDALDVYRRREGIDDPWETRERVVAAVSGAPGGEALIRRAARIAARARGELIGVHVTARDGRASVGAAAAAELARHRDLVSQLGGTYHEVVGEDVGEALVAFARAHQATQIVMGASERGRLAELVRGSVINRTVRAASGIDVHVIAPRAGSPVASTTVDATPRRRPSAWIGAVPVRRQLAGAALLAVLLPVLTIFLVSRRDVISFASDLLLYLGVVVAASAVGGIMVALVGALVASLLANFYLVDPVHTFTISESQNLLALAVFLAIAATVSAYVNIALRNAERAHRARTEAEGLARATATLAGAADPLPSLAEHLRTTFGLAGVAVMERNANRRWDVVVSTGEPIAEGEGDRYPLDPDERTVLVLSGVANADDQVVLRAYADQLAVALSARRLQEEAAQTSVLAHADALRTALLQAVSHDLRTPLAGIKASVSSLLTDDVEWDDAARHEFLVTIDAEADRLNRLLSNLLDMSRLQVGALMLHRAPAAVEDLVSGALSSVSGDSLPVDVVDLDCVPLVDVDAALVERAIANLITNAVRHSPAGERVRITATATTNEVQLFVRDKGIGIPPSKRAEIVRPFQRLGDSPGDNGGGIGLGLAVAQGFVTAVGGRLEFEDTPGGGLTAVVTLPVATIAGS
ncbi:MAG: ATP-binding protein [Acidimicrobiia bacterium]